MTMVTAVVLALVPKAAWARLRLLASSAAEELFEGDGSFRDDR
jgi:hypothetical protein